MKKMVKVIVAILLIFAVNSSVYSKETIRLASGEWSPYQSKNLKYFGVASRIITEAFAISNIEVKYDYFPWSRSLQYAQSGEWDGTFLWFDTPERRKDFWISDAVLDIQYVFFHLKEREFSWKTVDDLTDLFIGGTLKYNYGSEFQEAEKSGTISVERVPSDEINFRKLLAGRIDIFPNDLDAGLSLVQSNFSSSEANFFTYNPHPVKLAPHHLLLSKKNPKNENLIKVFNYGLKKLKESGAYNQYLLESRDGKYKY